MVTEAATGTMRKVGGACLIAGTLLTGASGIAHPRSGDAGYPRPFLESVISHRWFWAPDHVVMFFGSLIGIVGLFVLTSTLVVGLAGRIARGAFAMAILGQALLGCFVAIDGAATPRLAQVWDDASGATRESAFLAARVATEIGWAFNGLFFVCLFGLAFGLYGVALALDGRYGRATAAIIPVSILAVILGIVELIAGPMLALVWVQNVLMILTLVWLAWIGTCLLGDPEP
jgi:hypothetical protein